MFTRFLRATLLLGVIFAGFCEPAVAGCQKDCNSSCYKERWGAKYDDPVCRSACKARNKACKVGIPKPDIPGEPDPSVLPPDPREDIDNACAAPFETLTGYVRTQCGDYEGRMGDRRVIQDAREILIASRIFKPSEFDGVTIRWCPLDGAEGMSPAPGIVYLDSSMEGAHVLDIASLLAHEMQHERQWRRHKNLSHASTPRRTWHAVDVRTREIVSKRKPIFLQKNSIGWLTNSPPDAKQTMESVRCTMTGMWESCASVRRGGSVLMVDGPFPSHRVRTRRKLSRGVADVRRQGRTGHWR